MVTFNATFSSSDQKVENVTFSSNEMKINADYGKFQKVTERGIDGLSAYEIAVENGFVGSETEWLASLQGAPGPVGPEGPQGLKGDTGSKGADGFSPTITTSKSGKVTTLTIKDASGTKTATINDGDGIYTGDEEPESTVPYDADTSQGYSLASLMLKLYPVGSIYLSVNSTSPASLFGGTWERIQDRFLLASGGTYSAGSTGGSATSNVELHNLPGASLILMARASDEWSTGRWQSDQINTYSASTPLNQQSTYNYGQPINNMPPYLAVYIWKRTA